MLKALNARGIGAGVHYPFALHELKAYASLGHGPGAFPVAEDWARRCLSLPIYPELTLLQAEFLDRVPPRWCREHQSLQFFRRIWPVFCQQQALQAA